MEELCSQHRTETLRQQEAHLRQLHALQAQLLQELSETPSSPQPLLQLGVPGGQGGEVGLARSLPPTIPLSLPLLTEPSDQDALSLQDTSDLLISPNQSLEFLQLPPPHLPLTLPAGSSPGVEHSPPPPSSTSNTSPPPRTEQPHTPPPPPSPPTANQPTRSVTRPAIPKGYTVAATPPKEQAEATNPLSRFAIASPPPKTVSSSLSQPTTHSFPLHHPPSISSPLTLTSYLKSPISSIHPLTKETTPTPHRHQVDEATPTPHCQQVGVATPTPHRQHVGVARAALVEKHNRHVEDITQFYESELSALRREVEELREEGWRTLPLSSSPARPKAGREEEEQSLHEGDHRLNSGYLELCRELEEATLQRRGLEAQVRRLQDHVDEWRSRHEAAERLTVVLQERLESTRTQLHQMEQWAEKVDEDLRCATEELQFWREQRTQHVEKMDQLFSEFEVLQRENKSLQLAKSSLEDELYESTKELSSLRAASSRHQSQESHYRSTISKMEDELRSLQHENNRLHSQATHYGLGYLSPYNKADEDKLHYTPHRNTPVAHTGPRWAHRPLTSPHPPASTSLTPTHASGETPDSYLPSLTRKKWLEPSDPGLITGGSTNTQPTPPAFTPLRRPSSSRQGTVELEDRGSPVLQMQRRGSPRQEEGEKGSEGLADSALQAIRDGNVLSGEGHQLAGTYRKHSGPPLRLRQELEKSTEDRVREHMEIVSEAEQKLVKLQTEKERLESALQRAPRSGGRVTHQAKQNQLAMEQRLEEVSREVGSTRMILRTHHALGN